LSGVNELQRAKTRYNEAKDFARRQAAVNLCPVLGVDFYLSNLSRRALEEVAKWPLSGRTTQGGGWDWDDLRRRFHGDLTALSVAIWAPDGTLYGLGLCRATGGQVIVEVVEGCPQGCPVSGKRLLILLEAATCYAQKLGKKEIVLTLVNARLKSLVEDTYGFRLEKPRKGSPYYRKEV
jgi:hypothetical protein